MFHYKNYLDVPVIVSGEPFSVEKHISNLNQYIGLSDTFHSPRGEGYKYVLSFLERYLELRFICENSRFHFHESLLDNFIDTMYQAAYPKTTQPAGEKEVVPSRRYTTAALLDLFDNLVKTLETHPQKKYQQYGTVLRTTYMTPEYINKDMASIVELLGLSNKRYYEARSKAITLLSQILFGVLVGEYGFTGLEITDEGIRISKEGRTYE